MSHTITKPSVSFVVPALNEEGNVAATVATILQAAEHCCRDFEIILVNDGSSDRTGAIMEDLAKTNSHIRVLHNERNLGFGGAFKRGAAAAQKDYVIRICADNVSPAEMIERILNHAGEADLVIPYLSNPEFRPMGRRIGSWGFTTLINILFGLRVPYYNHSVVFRRDVLNAITITTNGFVYQAEAVVKLLKAGCSFVAVTVADVPRVQGKSTALKPKNLLNVFRAIYNLVREVRRPGAIPDLSTKKAEAIETQ